MIISLSILEREVLKIYPIIIKLRKYKEKINFKMNPYFKHIYSKLKDTKRVDIYKNSK